MIMNKFFRLLVFGVFSLSLFVGCEKAKDQLPIDEISPEEEITIFDVYHFNDTTGFKENSVRSANTSDAGRWITGIKNKKLWIGLFNDESYEQLDEWITSEELPENKKRIGIAPPLLADWGYATYGFATDKQIDTSLDWEKEKGYIYLLKDGDIKTIDLDISVAAGEEPNLSASENDLYIKNPKANKNSLIYFDGEFKILDEVSFYQMGDTIITSFIENEKLGFRLVGENWMGETTFDRHRKYHIGYGEYEEYQIDNFEIGSISPMEWGYVIVPTYYTQDGDIHTNDDVIFMSDKSVYCYQYVHDPQKWYNNSILVRQNGFITNSSKDQYIVLNSKAEKILSFEDNDWGNSDYMMRTLFQSACSYSNLLKITMAKRWASTTVILVENYDCVKNETIWSNNLEYEGEELLVATDDRVEVNLLRQEKNLWTFLIDTYDYSGAHKAIKFQVNADNGEITYLPL